MDVDGSENKPNASLQDDMIAFGVAAAGQSFSALTWQSKDIANTIDSFLQLLVTANKIQSRQIAMANMTALGTVFNKVDDQIALKLRIKEVKLAVCFEQLLFQTMYPSYGVDFKLQRAKVVYVVAGLAWGKTVLLDRLDSEISGEPSDVVREELKQARSRLR